MEYKLLQAESEPAYRNFVDGSPEAKVYHRLEWREILQAAYGFSPCYLAAQEGQTVRGVLPLFQVNGLVGGRRLVALPFSHWVNVLYGGDPEVLAGLMQSAAALAEQRGCRYVEVKHGWPLPQQPGWQAAASYYDSLLDLTCSSEELWKGLADHAVRYGIRKAQKSGVQVRRGTGETDFLAFYNMEVETRRHQGAPVYPYRFFSGLAQRFDNSRLRLYLAEVDGRSLAGVILLCQPPQAVYAYSASSKDPQDLAKEPTKLALWEAIRDLKTEGYLELDFGTTPPSNPGLLDFKRRWGTRELRLPYYYRLVRTNTLPGLDRGGQKMRLVENVLRRLPLPVFRWIGPLLLRQVG